MRGIERRIGGGIRRRIRSGRDGGPPDGPDGPPPFRRRVGRGALAAALVALLAAGCGSGGPPELETRTFRLEHVSAGEISQIIGPYVWKSRPGAPGTASFTESTVTVRETADNLEKIAAVLEEYDVPQPTVRLHFQLIEADGDGEADPTIARIEEQLRRLFRFEGYRLAGQTVAEAVENGELTRTMIVQGNPISVSANVDAVRWRDSVATVTLDPVRLHATGRSGGRLASSLRVRTGQTVVIGSAPSDLEGGTVILTVRAELADPPAGAAGSAPEPSGGSEG